MHRHLGPGLLESAYEQCLCHELHFRELTFKCQVGLPVSYKGLKLDCGYKIDLIVSEDVVVELKAVVHETRSQTSRTTDQFQRPITDSGNRPENPLKVFSVSLW